jgi:hypothetical protein
LVERSVNGCNFDVCECHFFGSLFRINVIGVICRW